MRFGLLLLALALVTLPACDAVESVLDSLSQPSQAELDELSSTFGCDVEGISRDRSGRLAVGDCTLDVDGSLIDLYAFRMTSEDRVRVTVESDEFAPYLIVYNEFATPVVQEGADGAGTATIEFDANEGLFVIGANSEQAGETGPYTVRVERL